VIICSSSVWWRVIHHRLGIKMY